MFHLILCGGMAMPLLLPSPFFPPLPPLPLLVLLLLALLLLTFSFLFLLSFLPLHYDKLSTLLN